MADRFGSFGEEEKIWPKTVIGLVTTASNFSLLKHAQRNCALRQHRRRIKRTVFGMRSQSSPSMSRCSSVILALAAGEYARF